MRNVVCPRHIKCLHRIFNNFQKKVKVRKLKSVAEITNLQKIEEKGWNFQKEKKLLERRQMKIKSALCGKYNQAGAGLKDIVDCFVFLDWSSDKIICMACTVLKCFQNACIHKKCGLRMVLSTREMQEYYSLKLK